MTQGHDKLIIIVNARQSDSAFVLVAPGSRESDGLRRRIVLGDVARPRWLPPFVAILGSAVQKFEPVPR